MTVKLKAEHKSITFKNKNINKTEPYKRKTSEQ
jgi:hypothetical protein